MATDTVTLAQIVNEVIYPVLALLGVLLRAAGVLCAGIVAGVVLRHGVLFKMRTRFFIPLIFLGIVVLFAVIASAPWSSPGSLAMLGIGLLAGYQFVGRGKAAADSKGQEES